MSENFTRALGQAELTEDKPGWNANPWVVATSFGERVMNPLPYVYVECYTACGYKSLWPLQRHESPRLPDLINGDIDHSGDGSPANARAITGLREAEGVPHLQAVTTETGGRNDR